jgi:hypothetical protein
MLPARGRDLRLCQREPRLEIQRAFGHDVMQAGAGTRNVAVARLFARLQQL